MEVNLAMGKIWRGGMIGAGAWSAVQLDAWAEVPNAEIVALCDRHPDRRNSVLRRFGIPQGFDDFEVMLDEAELDFVDICTRPYSHAPLAKLSARRELPILCQKPFCTSLEEAREVVDYCEQAGVRLMVNENFRWQVVFRQIKELLDGGIVGKPFMSRLQDRVRMTLPQFSHRQSYLAEMPRLIAYEMGVHYLDTLRFLFGDPDTVFARLHHVSPHVKGEDVQVITLGYEGLTCQVVTSWASVPVHRTEGEKKGAAVEPPRIEIDGPQGPLVYGWDGALHFLLMVITDSGHSPVELGSQVPLLWPSSTL
jgi:predicted dehydrogenase